MLKDDAIRLGLIEPSKEDIERMHLTDGDLAKFAKPTEAVPVMVTDEAAASVAAMASGNDKANKTAKSGK